MQFLKKFPVLDNSDLDLYGYGFYFCFIKTMQRYNKIRYDVSDFMEKIIKNEKFSETFTGQLKPFT